MPSKRAREQADARIARLEQLEEFDYCEPAKMGMPGQCFPRGRMGLTVHHVWPTGRGGPLGDRRSMVTACRYHNDECSGNQQVWAADHQLLFHEREGREWLERGGFQRDRD